MYKQERRDVCHFFQVNSPLLPDNLPNIAVKYNLVRFIQKICLYLKEKKILSWGKDLSRMVDDIRHAIEKNRAERHGLKNPEWVKGNNNE